MKDRYKTIVDFAFVIFLLVEGSLLAVALLRAFNVI